MAGLMSRAATIIKAKFSALLNRAENPSETLDYSYEKQLESLQNVKRGVADVVTAKKRLQMQARAAAIDELVASGSLDDLSSNQTQLDRELAQLSSQSQVDQELERLKAEVGSGAAPQKELDQAEPEAQPEPQESQQESSGG